MTDIATIMRTSAVIPVLVIDDAATAKPLAEALVAGGLKVLEVTLRTPAALEAMAEMKKVPGAIVGAGTVANEQQLRCGRGIRRLAGPDRSSGCRGDRQRHPLSAGHRQCGRHHARA